jgi:hypothetical protein
MDMGLQSGAASIVATLDGNASLYTTGTFGIIGGIGHEHVRARAIRMCKLAVPLLEYTSATTDFTYPDNGRIRFFILTSSGVRSAEVASSQLAAGQHALSGLFAEANRLIAELRQVSENAG